MCDSINSIESLITETFKVQKFKFSRIIITKLKKRCHL